MRGTLLAAVCFMLGGAFLIVALLACERIDPKTAEAVTEGAVELVDAVCEETAPENGLARFLCKAADVADDVLSKTAAGSTSAIAGGNTPTSARGTTAPGARPLVVRMRPEAVASFCRANRCTFKAAPE